MLLFAFFSFTSHHPVNVAYRLAPCGMQTLSLSRLCSPLCNANSTLRVSQAEITGLWRRWQLTRLDDGPDIACVLPSSSHSVYVYVLSTIGPTNPWLNLQLQGVYKPMLYMVRSTPNRPGWNPHYFYYFELFWHHVLALSIVFTMALRIIVTEYV